MIIYPDGERSNLYDKLLSLYEVEHVGSLGAYYDDSLQYTYVVIQGEPCKIQTRILFNIVFYDPGTILDLFNQSNDDFFKLHTLINIEPFIRVPLYLNSIPDVAAWRLEIGK